MQLWDSEAKSRLTMFAIGLCGGAALLLIPRTPQVVETVRVVTKTVEVDKEVVKWKTRNVDRVVTIDKPGGEKIVIVDKTKETDTTQSEEHQKEVSKDTTKTTVAAQARYSLGVEYTYARAIAVTGGVRLGGLPLWLTATAGDAKLAEFQPRFSVGVRWEW
jgi:hypothetical protein